MTNLAASNGSPEAVREPPGANADIAAQLHA
jgi:hypothetical protein